MPNDEVRRILAIEGVRVFDDHLEVLVGSVRDDASSRSKINERVDVDCCTPRTGLLLKHLEFTKFGLCSPGAHAACRRDYYRCGLDQRAPSCC